MNQLKKKRNRAPSHVSIFRKFYRKCHVLEIERDILVGVPENGYTSSLE